MLTISSFVVFPWFVAFLFREMWIIIPWFVEKLLIGRCPISCPVRLYSRTAR